MHRKFVPLSNNKVQGGPYQAKIWSTNNSAIVSAVIFGTANASGHQVRQSEKITMYLLWECVGGNGPKQSTVTLSKGPSTGIGNKGALICPVGIFFVAQSAQDFTQCSQSAYLFFQKYYFNESLP